jgi:hypothetical protein
MTACGYHPPASVRNSRTSRRTASAT